MSQEGDGTIIFKALGRDLDRERATERKPGNSKLVYDKTKRAIVAVRTVERVEQPEHGVTYSVATHVPSPFLPVYAFNVDRSYEGKVYFDGTEWHDLTMDNFSRHTGWYPTHWTRLPPMPEAA
jgi:hypothetical protein